MKRTHVAMLVMLLCQGCVNAPKDTDAFHQVMVPKHEPISFVCAVSTETIKNYQIQQESRTLWDFPAMMYDEGSVWRASDKFGVMVSPQMYRGGTNRIDGNVNRDTGERYYRANFPVVMYNYSKIDSKGNGSGRTYYNCK